VGLLVGLAVLVSNGVAGGSTSVTGRHGMCCGVASGLLTALKNDGAGGYDLFFEFIGRKSQQFIDRVVKESFFGS
jgi:hypothetical protein